MNSQFKHYAPRVLGIMTAVLYGIFATDSGSAAELAIHLVPSAVMVLGTVILWKKPAIAGFFFLALGAALTLFFRTYKFHLSFLLLSGPLFLTGALYLAWRKHTA